MTVALTVGDFLRRAELLYRHRVGIIDEPDQRAESLGSISPGEVLTIIKRVKRTAFGFRRFDHY